MYIVSNGVVKVHSNCKQKSVNSVLHSVSLL